ncbi:TonB-dependent receptor [Dyadobacter fermentans]|uniref:TonB-dependent receptor n=1 Tax=Dyadobacter fermentans TaxID=94254 RepID=UPI001CC0B1EE|nr:TonB-dependent receptor [Dyadobacter fermentans]MBZ1363023.1 TonB-dependent receptor [Dyadobacter fermentans]
MKKGLEIIEPWRTIMKVSSLQILLAIIACTYSYGGETHAQELLLRKVSIEAQQKTIRSILAELAAAENVKFVYSKELLPVERKISLSAHNKNMSEVLDQIFSPDNISYKIVRNRIILKPAGREPSGALSLDYGSTLAAVQNVLDKNIKGVVTAGKSEPLPGVNIAIKGTTRGTSTDANGAYSLDVPDNGAILVFSFVGHVTQEVKVGDAPVINVDLVLDNKALEEVVVVGYNSQSKRNLISAVATVSGETITKRVATNPVSLLQGQLPGLQVIQGSGEPGNEGIQLRVRGTGTFSGAGNDPLVIVDGLPGDLSILNPNNIESITVLKDAASAAIYGARGANGVIVVKTKNGNGGGFAFGYGFNIGISNPTQIPKTITNSAEFMELSNEARTNSNLQPLYTQAQIDLYRNATDRVKYPNHNWLDDLFNPAYVKNHFLNMSGGSKDGTTFNVGLGITDQPGVMIGFDYKKYTMNLGLSSKVHKRVTLGTNLQFRYGDQAAPSNGSTDMFLSTMAQSPLYPPQTADGKWIKRAFPNEQGNKNTIATVAEKSMQYTKDYYAQGNMSLDVDVLDGLRWENKAGFNYQNTKWSIFRPVVPMYYFNDMSSAGLLDVGTPGLNVQRNDLVYSVFYSQLNYHKTFGDNAISILGGYQQEKNQTSKIAASRRQFPTNLLTELDAGPADGQTNGGTSEQWAIHSLYATANYSLKDKYLLGGSVRYDGTSRLPSDTRWGLFYSFSAGWRISKETFLQNANWLNDMKLRASYGQLGNQNIGTYPYQSTLSNANYAFGGSTSTGFAAQSIVDPNLTWETTRSVNAGVDITAFSNKITFSADVFNKYTFDILRGSQVPLWLGLNAPTINNGAVRNKGIELNVAYSGRTQRGFSYTVGLNAQAYKNKLEKFGKTEINTVPNSIREEGHPLDEFYVYIWDGIFQNQAEIDASPKQPVTPTPGDLKIKDVNGDGVISEKDRTYQKGRYPAMQLGVNFSANWKGFDLATQIFSSVGQKIYVNGWGIEPFRQGSVPTVDWRNRWTPTNPSNTMPKIYVADGYAPVQNYNSTYFLKNASFARLKNIQLGYTIPKSVIDKVKMKSVRVFVSGENVLTVSKFPGLDPERVNSGNYLAYPQNRTYTFGINVQF